MPCGRGEQTLRIIGGERFVPQQPILQDTEHAANWLIYFCRSVRKVNQLNNGQFYVSRNYQDSTNNGHSRFILIFNIRIHKKGCFPFHKIC